MSFTPDAPELKATPGFVPDDQSSAEAQANAAQAQETEQQSKYGIGKQQLIAGAEAAGRGVAGPLATLAETISPEKVTPILRHLGPVGILAAYAKEKLGKVNPEDIRGREEANPITSAIGTIGGLLVPGGQGAALEKVGAKLVSGIAEKGILKGMTRGAIKLGAENAMYQSGDEVSKMIMQDPNQTIGTAISNIGLAGAIGAAAGGTLGSVSGLWKAKVGDEAGKFLEDFKTRMKEHLDIPVETPAQMNAPTRIDPFTKESYIPKSDIQIKPNQSNMDPFTKLPTQFETKPIQDTVGGKVADTLVKHSDTIINKTLGGSVGAAIGHMSGIPYGGTIGAIIGERVLSPFFKSVLPSIGKQILEKDISIDGFKAAADYGMNVVKGQKLTNSAVKSVFNTTEVLPESKRPNADTRKKINLALDSFQQDPAKIANSSGAINHYLPDHAVAVGSTMANTMSFLNGLRPQEAQRAPLDPKMPISKAVQSQYDRVLDIAQQPLIVLDSIKNGTLTSHDVMAIQTMYPALYKGLQAKVMAQMVDQVAKEEIIPYKTRLGLSMFLQQPLDSTMKPLSIASAQPTPEPQPPQMPENPKKVSQAASSNLIKGSKTAQTASQASEAMHATGGKA